MNLDKYKSKKKTSILKFLSLNQLKFFVFKIIEKNNNKIQNKYRLIKKFPMIADIGSVAKRKMIKLSVIFNFFDIIIRNY